MDPAPTAAQELERTNEACYNSTFLPLYSYVRPGALQGRASLGGLVPGVETP